MRFHSRGLDDVFVYPCTKADIKTAFGEELLESASLGGHSVDHRFDRRETPGEITGRVLLTVGVSLWHWPLSEPPRQRACLRAYRVRREDWCDDLHRRMREMMGQRLRPWVESRLARAETERQGREEMLVELREGQLFVHKRRSK